MVVELTVAGWFVSVCLAKLADHLIQDAKEWYKGEKDFGKNTHELKRLLDKTEAAIKNAEVKELDDSKLQAWVWRLRDAVYSAEDVLDSIRYVLLKKQVKRNLGLTDSVGQQIRHIFSPGSKHADELRRAVDKLRNVVADMGDFLDLVGDQHALQKLPPTEAPDWRVTTPFDKPCKLVGRQKAAAELMDFLLSPGQGNKKVSCISVLGMGGIGKTALVRQAYNNSGTTGFAVKAWICVSHIASNKRILIDTINEASKEVEPHIHRMPLGRIKRALADLLKGQKVLIVLDDVWNLSRDIVDEFDMAFSEASEGSKLIVTTRDSSIAEEMSTTRPIHLQGIQFEDYLQLFEEHAFGKKDPGCYPELRSICRSIATRLNGLPQAAETYGRALRSNLHQNHWRGISKRKMHEMGAGKRDIMPTLRLSYEQLPRDLKECFVSCSLFPKDYMFQKEEIIRIWMALGFLGAGDGGERMEDMGEKNFTQLLERSFFKKNKELPETYIMPGPLHELAEFLSAGEYFRIERGAADYGPRDIPSKARHVYLDSNNLGWASNALHGITNLRSLLIVGKIASSSCQEKTASSSEKLVKTLEDLIKATKRLRVLMVPELLPANVGQLKHLRYLQFHVENNIGNLDLPKSICKLYQLQTLVARFCGRKWLMLEDISQLISLRFLDTEPTETVCTIANIGRLTSLQEVASFEVREKGEFGIGQLENMDQLRGHLCISGLEIVKNKDEALKAKLHKKEYISRLELCWKLMPREETVEAITKAHEAVLEGLQPHCSLSDLKITGYTGKKPPKWLKRPQALELNLRRIELWNCSGWKHLPSFGLLPYLKILHLRQMRSLQRIKAEFYGQDTTSSFPQLQELLFDDLCNLKEWCLPKRGIQLFPNLCSVSITNCHKLKGPLALPSSREKLIILLSDEKPELNDPSTQSILESKTSSPELKLHLDNTSILGKCIPDDVASSIRILEIHGSTLLQYYTEMPAALTSLNELLFINCFGLYSLPSNIKALQTLESLVVDNCPNIRKDSIHPSEIADIPKVVINGEYIRNIPVTREIFSFHKRKAPDTSMRNVRPRTSPDGEV